MGKLENMIEFTKLNELLNKKEEKKKSDVLLWVFAAIGVIVAVAAVCYAIYRYLNPDYLDDFEDEFEDDFEDEEDDDDDLYEDESES